MLFIHDVKTKVNSNFIIYLFEETVTTQGSGVPGCVRSSHNSRKGVFEHYSGFAAE
jgi:hypothetical protein